MTYRHLKVQKPGHHLAHEDICSSHLVSLTKQTSTIFIVMRNICLLFPIRCSLACELGTRKQHKFMQRQKIHKDVIHLVCVSFGLNFQQSAAFGLLNANFRPLVLIRSMILYRCLFKFTLSFTFTIHFSQNRLTQISEAGVVKQNGLSILLYGCAVRVILALYIYITSRFSCPVTGSDCFP